MANNFKLVLEKKRKDNNEPVSYKIDGQKFDHTNTIYLNVNTVYNVRMTFRSTVPLLKLIIHGESLDVEVESVEELENKRVYNATYNTGGHGHSKNGKRKEVPFVFELEAGLILKTQLQCKFYAEKEIEHNKWGNKLTSIEYDCHVSEGHTYVDITKERYL